MSEVRIFLIAVFPVVERLWAARGRPHLAGTRGGRGGGRRGRRWRGGLCVGCTHPPSPTAEDLVADHGHCDNHQTAGHPWAAQGLHRARSSPAQRFRTTTAREIEPIPPESVNSAKSVRFSPAQSC